MGAISGFPCILEGRVDAATKPVIGGGTDTKPVSVDWIAGGTAAAGAATGKGGTFFPDCPDVAVSSIAAKTEPQTVSIREIVSARFLIRYIKNPPALRFD
jgi:hypothetical protein